MTSHIVNDRENRPGHSVLVAGVTGTLGRGVADYLAAEGWGVQGVARGPGEFRTRYALCRAMPRVLLIEGDLCDMPVAAEASHGMDAIVFAAGLSGVLASISDVEGNLIGNAIPFLNLLESCQSGTHVVLFSSQLVYGPSGPDPFHESDVLHPASPYALHRVLLEGYARFFAQHRQLAVTVLRLGNVFGPVMDVNVHRSHGVVARMFTDLVRCGTARLYGDGSQLLELLHVSDLARATHSVLAGGQKPGDFAVYNIGGQSMSVREIADALRDGLGYGSIATEAWPLGVGESSAQNVRLDDGSFRATYDWTAETDVRQELAALGLSWISDLGRRARRAGAEQASDGPEDEVR